MEIEISHDVCDRKKKREKLVRIKKKERIKKENGSHEFPGKRPKTLPNLGFSEGVPAKPISVGFPLTELRQDAKFSVRYFG